MVSAHGKFAVVLNANARRVNELVRRQLEEIVKPEDLFYSGSPQEAEEIARIIIERGYETVFAGGGDGTVVHLINSLSKYPPELIPCIGILKLGTGNAMARMVVSGDILADLKSYIKNKTREYYYLSLVEAEGKRFPFAGLGWDARILNDYRYIKDKYASNKVLKPLLQNVFGYFFSFFVRTVPDALKDAVEGKKVEAEIVTLDRAWKVGAGGVELKEYKPGDVLYKGSITVAMIGTVPFYGYGLKILPYANIDPDRMHLRVSNLGVGKGLMIFPRLWNGKYSGPGVDDFLVKEVYLKFSDEMPYQTGGDAAGFRKEIQFRIVPRAVRLLRII